MFNVNNAHDSNLHVGSVHNELEFEEATAIDLYYYSSISSLQAKKILSCIGRKGFGIRIARRQYGSNAFARVGAQLIAVRLRSFL